MLPSIGTILGISIFSGIVMTPFLIRNLNGPRRIHLVLQQICIIVYMSLQLAQVINESDVQHQLLFAAVDEQQGYQYDQKVLSQDVFALIKEWFYLQYYWLSMLHTYDINIMVCQPFNYSSFSKIGNTMKWLGWGLVCCIFAASDNAFVLFFRYFSFGGKRNKNERKMTRLAWVMLTAYAFKLVKLILMKIVYGATNIKIYMNVKKSLDDSKKMSRKPELEKAHRKLLHFTMIPFVINILYLVQDVPNVLVPLLKSYEMVYKDNKCDNTSDIIMILSSVVVMIVSFSYFIGYMVCFPRVRKSMIC